jgi:hypothetical protein
MSLTKSLAGLAALILIFAGGIYYFAYASTTKPTTTKYDFLFSAPEDYQNYYGNKYILDSNNKVLLQKGDYPETEFQNAKPPQLYIYDTESNEKTKISVEEANKLKLLTGDKSPDGFKFENYYYQSGSAFILPFSQKNTTNVITKDGIATPTSLENSYGSEFVSWIDNQ